MAAISPVGREHRPGVAGGVDNGRSAIGAQASAFGDGRAFSYAILLRQRHAFAGELRAVGDVLLDEIPLMIRCGFSSFDVTNEATLRALREARMPKFPVAYQPGLSAGETRDASRPWARRLVEPAIAG